MSAAQLIAGLIVGGGAGYVASKQMQKSCPAPTTCPTPKPCPSPSVEKVECDTCLEHVRNGRFADAAGMASMCPECGAYALMEMGMRSWEGAAPALLKRDREALYTATQATAAQLPTAIALLSNSGWKKRGLAPFPEDYRKRIEGGIESLPQLVNRQTATMDPKVSSAKATLSMLNHRMSRPIYKTVKVRGLTKEAAVIEATARCKGLTRYSLGSCMSANVHTLQQTKTYKVRDTAKEIAERNKVLNSAEYKKAYTTVHGRPPVSPSYSSIPRPTSTVQRVAMPTPPPPAPVIR